MQTSNTFKNIDEFIDRINSIFLSNPRYTFLVQQFKKSTVSSQEITFDSDILKQITNDNVNLLLQMCKEKKDLQPYPYGNCKFSIEYRSIEHESINLILNNFLSSINNPSIPYKDSLDLTFQTYTIKVSTSPNDYILFLTKKSNPIYNLKRKTKYFILDDNSLVLTPKKLFQLTTTIDAIIYKGAIYFITLHLEKILGLETYAKIQKNKCINSFEKVLSNTEFKFLYPFLKSVNANAFNNILDDRIDSLANIQNKESIAGKLHIPLENTELNLSDPIAQKSLLSYCQNKIAINIENHEENVYSPIPYQPLKVVKAPH